MQSRTRLLALAVFGLSGVLALSVGGCPPVTTPGVLTGSWDVSTTPAISTPNLSFIVFGFDDNNQLTVIKAVFENSTLVMNSPANFTATTTVSGSNVTITSGTGSAGVLTIQYTGTLNSTDTVVTGTGSFVLTTNLGTITVPANSQIVLTKDPV